MHDHVHLTIVTSLSIIITFVLDCILNDIPVSQTYLQVVWIDFLRDLGLTVRCLYNQGMNNVTCLDFFPQYNAIYYVVHGVFIQILAIVIFFIPKITNYIFRIFVTSLTVEFLAQYFISLNFWWKIDILTIYLFVWQLISLVIAWICSHLLPPILIIEQGSFCLIMALQTWMWYFVFVRYIPLTYLLIWFWLFSVIDIFICLHHRGHLYHPSWTNQAITPRKKCQSGSYFIHGIDKWKTSGALGLGDFYTYNLLALFALPPSSSIIIKICVTLGSIVTIQVGRLLTFLLRRLTKTTVSPGIPLPVITVSLYLLILNIIIPTNFNRCTEL